MIQKYKINQNTQVLTRSKISHFVKVHLYDGNFSKLTEVLFYLKKISILINR